MKICLYNVTTTFAYGGIETYCIEMGKALVQRGHEVSIVAGRSDACIFQESALRVVQYPFRRRASFPDFGTRFRKLMERLSFGRHAWRHLLVADYDAIVVTKPFDFPVLWWVKRRGLRAPVMFHAGGTDFFLGDRLFANAVDRWAACSDHTAAKVAARYTRQVSTITNGVDTQRFAPALPDPSLRSRWQIPEQAPLIMSVGRLVGLKGLRVIIEALTGLPQAHYMVVGEGDERGRLEKLAQDLDIKARVHFLGSIANEKLPAILRAADLFVQPTIGEEAFGITVVEAMAMGLAVAASNNGGMREIINHGKNGMLIPSGDVSAWREIMGSLLQNPDRRRELGDNARTHVEQNFTWQAKAEQLERLLQGDSL